MCSRWRTLKLRALCHVISRAIGTAFKVEFKIFLCTRSRKYAGLRRDLAKGEGQSQRALVSLISTAIGAEMGRSALVLAPLVVVALITLLKIGKEAYCRTVNIDSLVVVPRESEHKDTRHDRQGCSLRRVLMHRPL